jgi:hypothetical protein
MPPNDTKQDAPKGYSTLDGAPFIGTQRLFGIPALLVPSAVTPAPPSSASALLMEDGTSYLLLEDGSRILLE